MNVNKTVWFDMDGTLADLYGVKEWLSYLKNENTLPYEICELKYEKVSLIKSLVILKQKGYNLGVISWTAKNGTIEYNQAVKNAKIEWLKRNGLYNLLDEILITCYGENKSYTCEKYGHGILVDDEKQNLITWSNGLTIDANKNILKELENL
jgi:hypothetical protein